MEKRVAAVLAACLLLLSVWDCTGRREGAARPPGSPEAAVPPSVEAALGPGLSEKYDGYRLTLEGDLLVITVWMEGTADLAACVRAGLLDRDFWENVRKGAGALAAASRALVDTAGRADLAIRIDLLNDRNHEKILLSLLGDTIIYDAALE